MSICIDSDEESKPPTVTARQAPVLSLDSDDEGTRLSKSDQDSSKRISQTKVARKRKASRESADLVNLDSDEENCRIEEVKVISGKAKASTPSSASKTSVSKTKSPKSISNGSAGEGKINTALEGQEQGKGIDKELERQAEEMAEKTLQNLPPSVRAAQALKVKHSILKRLKQELADKPKVDETGGSSMAQSSSADSTEAVPPPPPPPPSEPEAPAAASQEEQIALQKKKDLEAAKAKLMANVTVLQAEMMNPLAELHASGNLELPPEIPASQLAEQQREAERQKRKALWQDSLPANAREASPENSEGRLSANKWENSRFESTEMKGKFLRLMGAQKSAQSSASPQPEESEEDDDMPDDCPTFELSIGGEWVDVGVEGKDQDSDEAANKSDEDEDWEPPEDCPTIELSGGEWIQNTQNGEAPDTTSQNIFEHSAVTEELERQYLDGMKRQMSWQRRGGIGSS
eukprot:TRINITY_DN111535_c0_g1_i1.p1 TRINITY_DN111535_c0_g1~~TRINITY_DN111535_c0_g1_i1.p1  ORF type:complete len:462 (-),score=126.30 TRINITY_DN111535_c0_g1_i1:47-1432(-)